ncbi:MAG: 3'-5' exonuclease [Actinomycetaceae bacterium]|nr:3'-5' exonuclease [Actinomycetaceae bacterium]
MGFAVLDVETTGLSPRTDRIVEVAIVTLGDNGAAEGEWSSLVNPGRPVAASFVHGLTDEDVALAPSIGQLLPKITELMLGRAVVAHNAHFDVGFLNAAYARSGLDFAIPARATACTLELSKIYLPPGRHSLTAAARRAGIDTPTHHRALADAWTAARLLRHYLVREARGERYTERAISRRGTTTLPASWTGAAAVAADLAWPSFSSK